MWKWLFLFFGHLISPKESYEIIDTAGSLKQKAIIFGFPEEFSLLAVLLLFSWQCNLGDSSYNYWRPYVW